MHDSRMIPHVGGTIGAMASHPTPHSEAAPLVAHTRTPEPLSAHEDALLRRILAAASFHGAPQLLDQVRGIQLVPAISDAEHRIYIQHPDMPRSTFSAEGRTRIPNTVLIRTPDGHIAAQIDVWVERGHLRAMHIRWAGARVPMTLPNPEWVVVTPAIVPARATVAPSASTTTQPARSVTSRPTPTLPIALPSGRRAARVLVALLVLALAGAVIAGAYALGRSGAADVDAARATGVQQGTAAGTADGQVLGSFRGATEGEIAGRQSTYDAAVVKAQAAALARAKAAAAAKAEAARVAAAAAAAAAAAPRYVSNTNCSGYRDSRGYWICS